MSKPDPKIEVPFEYNGFIIDFDVEFFSETNIVSGHNWRNVKVKNTFSFKALNEETRRIYAPNRKGFRTVAAAMREIDYILKFGLRFQHGVA